MYHAEINAGSLMLPESRRIARLLLQNPTEEQWKHALRVENILQKRSPATAQRQAKLIRNRLENMDIAGWTMINDREQEVALQMVLAASIKHSRMLGDFMREIVGDRLRRLENRLSARDWGAFLADCAQRDPVVNTWSESTQRKLFQVIIRILAETRYLKSTRSMELATPPMIHPDVRRYLLDREDDYVLSCMEPTR
jgi:hypothetical protein